MATDEEDVPDGRCGFTLQPEDVNIDEYYHQSLWHKHAEAVSCWRPVWDEYEETGRCFWHADVDDKTVEDLQHYRSDCPERLDGAILRGIQAGDKVSFGECGLLGVEFEGGEYRRSDFTRSDLRWAQFTEVNLNLVDFSNADFRDVQFIDVDFQWTDFSDTDLEEVIFSIVDLRWAKFTDTEVKEVEFLNSNLLGTDFSGTKFWKVEIQNSDLQGTDFSNADFRKIDLLNVNLNRAKFSNMDLKGVDFTGNDLEKVKFSNIKLHKADFSNVNLQGAEFQNADLKEADLSDAGLQEGHFSETNLHGADFSDADLQVAVFIDAKLWKSEFLGTNLWGAEFSEIDAKFATFENANLQDAVFSAADCRYAIFSSALLYETVFEDMRINSGTIFYNRELSSNKKSEILSFLGRFTSFLSVVPESRPSSSFRPVCVYEADPSIEDSGESLDSKSLLPGTDRLEAARWVYRRLETLHEKNALSEEARKFHISKEEAERKLLKERGDPRRYVKTLMWALSKHGESVKRLLTWWFGVIVLAGLAFPFVGGVKEPDGTTYAIASLGELETWAGVNDVLLNVYFSVITFSTIGYGDLSPASPWSRVLVAGESLVGAILVALLVFVLGRRVAR
ncbi:pentapeptide repeat-containing protein [Halorhabdus sp. BNX81]|uniref:pentapeptide repeat-containing protein n=1 Tax=Halorhabdus sp. BNX81 TaxID=2980181 RepID=UPI0023DD47A5|nr:pentapeptide repeat-containing protein [Halorhabdus sp. BNX81]WEL22698.1 Pentapeptide repeat-containing protein [Halorhabdus sp. BNX81]